jgi:Protein of unknown function (DUF3551)
MKPTSKSFAASAAVLSVFAFFVMAAPAAQADEYCLTGNQAAHGCGYPSLETCQASAAGLGGMCRPAASNSTTNPNDAQAYQPKQAHAKGTRHPKQPAAQ